MKNFYEQFKTPIVTVVLIFLGFAIYTTLLGPIPFSINSVNTTKTDLFSASGNGEETAVPDTASISIGVTKEATTVEQAQNQVNGISSKLISDIKKLGVQDKDIKTTNYSVNPNYGSGGPQPLMMPETGSSERITGYTVTQNIEIKVKPLGKVNTVVDTATNDGANLVGGVYFTFSDDVLKELERKATIKAVSQAKEKAQVLANASGIRLGKIVNVVSSSNQPYFARDMALSNEKTVNPSQPTTITPGESKVTIGVTIYYETN
ncbi:MAG: SIMPL domain-containing protein [Candidatus Levybacteria bacterium]|nr:SIMPL domain-containing protein [Candidatus Levybacteria bacterium]